jgi:hypothetical protein
MLSRTLIIIGAILIVTGIVIGLAPRIPFLGRLPGDLYFRKDNVTFYFPLTTSIIISVVLSLLFYLFGRR